MRRSVTAVLLAVTVLAANAGCRGGQDDDGDLPDGAELMAAAADEMAGVQTVAMRLETDVDLGGLPVREVDGTITQAGDAQGTAQVEQFGQQVELRFVVVDETFHYQLLGGWQQLPLSQAAAFYDPSAILDPERGVSQVLRTATDPQVQRRDGDQYEVTATFDAQALAVLVPGATEDTQGTVWIGVDRPLLHRAEFPITAGGDTGTLSVELSDFDAPVTIVAP
jgi:lipoprotein LprG